MCTKATQRATSIPLACRVLASYYISMPERQQFNVYLPPALVRAVKYRALDEQRSLSDLVERALTRYLEGEPDVRD